MQPFAKPIYVTRPLLPPLDALHASLAEIWESGWLTNAGAKQAELEERLRRYLSVPHLSLFNNGTTALMVAVKALGLTGEVVTTPFTFPATPHALCWNGIEPVFADIDPATMNIDPAAVEAAVTPRTSAILAVHVFGTPCDWTAIRDIAARHRLKVIYDAAHAFGVVADGTPIGTLGDVSMFSFHATKTFHTAEGGALTTGDGALQSRFDLLRNFGVEDETTVTQPGLNGKMNELQAALGLLTLDMLEGERRKRAALKALYAERLGATDGIAVLADRPEIRNSYQHVVVRIDRDRFGRSRDDVYDALRRYNVMARKYFFPLCSDMPHFRALESSRPSGLANARKVAGETLCLPVYGDLPREHVAAICEIIIRTPKR